MTETTLWTLDELVQLVGQALSVDYDGAPSARIRDLPDRRLVRWYVTKGLVDRPAGTNGRNALYGRRHLLQLVAIKRRQAAGRSLAEIQAELAGAPDSTLERVARLDLEPPGTPAPRTQAAKTQAANTQTAAPERPRFWADRPKPEPLARPTSLSLTREPSPQPGVWPLQAIELSPGVTLLVDPARTMDANPDAVRAAARPLLDLLISGPTEVTDERSTP